MAAVGAALLAGCVGYGAFLLWRRRHGHGRRDESVGGPELAADQVIHTRRLCIKALHVIGSGRTFLDATGSLNSRTVSTPSM